MARSDIACDMLHRPTAAPADVYTGTRTPCAATLIVARVGTWLSLVERTLGVGEVAGSNPVVPTNKSQVQPALAAIQIGNFRYFSSPFRGACCRTPAHRNGLTNLVQTLSRAAEMVVPEPLT